MTRRRRLFALTIMAFACGLQLFSGGNTSRAADAPAAIKAPKLAIVKAVWGILPDGPSFDVTKEVACLVADNCLSVDAENANFGDPAPGNAGKKLKVDYILDGVAGSITAKEFDNISLGPVKKPRGGKGPRCAGADAYQ